MTPIPLTETQMAELFRLRAENAALKGQLAQLQNDVEFTTEARVKDYKQQLETIAQQAEVIEKYQEAWQLIRYRGGCSSSYLDEIIAIQPSPEILQARDERIAEACAAVISKHSGIGSENTFAKKIRSGEWKKYL